MPIQSINCKIIERVTLTTASVREAEATFKVETVMAWLLLTHSAARYSSDLLDWTAAVLPQKQATEQVQALLIKLALGSTHQ